MGQAQWGQPAVTAAIEKHSAAMQDCFEEWITEAAFLIYSYILTLGRSLLTHAQTLTNQPASQPALPAALLQGSVSAQPLVDTTPAT